MKWNIFKRVAELEQLVKDLKDFTSDYRLWFARLGIRVQNLESSNQALVNSNQALIGRHENIGERLKNLEHQVYMQSRQQDPQIAALEQQVKDLADFINDEDRRIEAIEIKLKRVDGATFAHSVQLNSKYSEVPPMPSLVDEDILKKRQYKREWYAKKVAKIKNEKSAQAAREKKNAYARAYYARTKGAKK